MKLADMLNAYAQSTGDKIMHRVGVAEALVQLVETSRLSRINAIDQFRDAMIGYVNESVELMKSADVTDKDELAASIRNLIEDMHADRRDILAGEAPLTYMPEMMPQRVLRDRTSFTPPTPSASLDLPPIMPTGNPGTLTVEGFDPRNGTSDKDGRNRGSKSAA